MAELVIPIFWNWQRKIRARIYNTGHWELNRMAYNEVTIDNITRKDGWTIYSGEVLASAGIKHDTGKLRYDLISPTSLEGLAEVLTFGANKYSARNWEKGMSYGRVFGAAMRHLWAWWAKKGSDPETGFSHLKHALCCIHFLVHYESHGTGTDDRP